MELYLNRHTFKEEYTLGNLTFEGIDESFPIVEDTVRSNGEKIYGKTAIPSGRYKVVLDVVSPKFSQYQFYMDVCEGKLPRLLDVPNFTGILIHCGVNETNSLGCLILNKRNGSLEKSKEYFKRMMEIFDTVEDKDNIYININNLLEKANS